MTRPANPFYAECEECGEPYIATYPDCPYCRMMQDDYEEDELA